MQSIIAVVLIIVTAGLILILSLPQFSRKRIFRPIAGLQRLNKAIGLAVENGTRIHVALGNGSVNQTNFAASLAGLATLIDAQGALRERYDLQPGTSYLLRPDQHVAARWRQLDAAKVRAAVNRATGNV